MKTIKQITTAIFIITVIGLSTSCKKNPFKKDLDEILIEHKWKVTEWTTVPPKKAATEEDLIELWYRSQECYKNSYSEYTEDSMIFFHDLCNDTIINNEKWAVEGNKKLIITSLIHYEEIPGYSNDNTQTWEVLHYSRKKIEIKKEYTGYDNESGAIINYTVTKTLESF